MTSIRPSSCVKLTRGRSWRNEYGGFKVDQSKRLKELERENSRLKRAVTELTVNKLILKDAAEGNF